MALGGVYMTDTDGNIGRETSNLSEKVCGLLFDISGQTDFWTTGPGLEVAGIFKDNVVEFNTLAEAVEAGIAEYSELTNENAATYLLNGVVYYHLKQHFNAIGGSGRLFVMFADCSTNWNALVEMQNAAKAMNGFKTVVCYDPADANLVKQTYGEYGIELDCKVVTYTSFLAELVKDGSLKATNTGKTVVYQDPFQLARDLEETEEARAVISAFATLHEMHLNRGETVWAGNILMAQYIPDVMKLIAGRRIFNAKSLNESTIVTASVSEYASLKAAADENIEILSIEDLILG